MNQLQTADYIVFFIYFILISAYGIYIKTKKDFTGAVKSLKAESFNKANITTPQELLQGKVSGVNVTSVSGHPGVQLGITSTTFIKG